MKSKFPVFTMWTLDHTLIYEAFCVGAALVNIDMATGHPLKQYCEGCSLCV
jgi:epoxyqueuosine reductase QueG